MVVKDKIVKAAGKKGKSKVALAEKLHISYSACSAAVNELVAEGELVVVGKEKAVGAGRPAVLYGVK